MNELQQAPIPSEPAKVKSNWIIPIVVALIVILTAAALLILKKPVDNRILQSPSSGSQVIIKNDGFSPSTVRIKKGESVTWLNQDSASHQVASDPHPTHDGLSGLYDDESLAQNESFSFVFDESGTFGYHDHLNPLTFKGTVIVE